MSKYPFVVSVADIPFEKAKLLVDRYPFFELRLDLIDWSWEQINRFTSQAKQIILTCKPKDQNIERLEKIDFTEADYVDIDLAATNEYHAFILNLLPSETPVIWSIHYYNHFVHPSAHRAEFETVRKEKDLYKFVSLCSNESEAKMLLNAYSLRSNEIFIGMGKAGRVTRENALEQGAPFMYCQAKEIGSVAEGQLLYDEMLATLPKEITDSEYFCCGVIGNPIVHSKSPQLFNYFFDSNKINAHYLRIALESIEELDYLRSFLPLRFVNITSPFKGRFSDQRPVNYLEFSAVDNPKNTDIIALEEMVRACDKDTLGLIVGTGGAAEAAALALGNLNIKIHATGRTQEKLRTFSQRYNTGELDYDKLAQEIDKYSLIIWTIPADVAKEKDIEFTDKQFVLDANYKNKLEEIVKVPKVNYRSGIDWLIRQALPVMNKMAPAPSFDQLHSILTKSLSDKAKMISLIGMPGSGKTAVGKILAQEMGWEFKDLDAEIEKTEGLSIPEIFEKKGENYFRRLEKQVLVQQLKKEDCILATGGGTIIDKESRDILNEKSMVVWLGVSLEDIIERVQQSDRPLFNSGAPRERAKQLWNQRIKFYAETAHFIISTGKKPNLTARRIEHEYNSL